MEALIALGGVILGFCLTLARDSWNYKKAIDKEYKEFIRIEKLMPQIMQAVKKGLSKNQLATELIFDVSYKDCENYIDDTPEIDYYYISFGGHFEQITEEFFNKEKDIKDFLVGYNFARKKKYGSKFIRTKLILNPEFIAKIDKWVKPK